MRKLFIFLYNFRTFLTFVILELSCFLLIIQYNKYQSVAFLNSSNQVVGTIFKITANIEDYFILKSKNEEITMSYSQLQITLDSLQQANDQLLSHQKNLEHKLSSFDSTQQSTHPLKQFLIDTTLNFQYTPAKVINNSVLYERNYITLNKGTKDGIKVDMGVICTDGIVGKVVSVSENFSTVMSLLNTSSNISSELKGNLCSTIWHPYDSHKARIKFIPRHLKIKTNEVVKTSGYNSIFPKGIMIGTVSKATLLPEESYYSIDIDLSTNFQNLYYVYVVKKFKKQEQLTLEAENNGK